MKVNLKLGVIVLLLLTFVARSMPVAAALDASFQPKATVTFTCPSADKTKKKLTKFINNVPTGSTVFLMEGTPSSGGISFGNQVKVGDEFSNTPRLFWSIKDVYLGSWEATTVLDKSCSSTGTTTNWLFYAAPIGAVAAAVIFVLHRRQTKR